MLSFALAAGTPAKRLDLGWLLPSTWVIDPREGPDLTAHAPGDPLTFLIVVHTDTTTPVNATELKRQIETSRKHGFGPTAAAIGTCSDRHGRFPCSETVEAKANGTSVSYAWLDTKSKRNFAAVYSAPSGRQDELLPRLRQMVGWKLKSTIDLASIH